MEKYPVGISIFYKIDAAMTEEDKRATCADLMRQLASEATAQGLVTKLIEEDDDDERSPILCLPMKVTAESLYEAQAKAQSWARTAVLAITPHGMEITGIAPGVVRSFVN